MAIARTRHRRATDALNAVQTRRSTARGGLYVIQGRHQGMARVRTCEFIDHLRLCQSDWGLRGETGFYMQNNEAIECPVLGRAQLTTFQRQGAHTLAACTSVCDAAKYGVDIGGSGGNANCDCDASLFRRWHAESETCMCGPEDSRMAVRATCARRAPFSWPGKAELSGQHGLRARVLGAETLPV